MSTRPRFLTSLLSFLSTTSPKLPLLKRAHAVLTVSGLTSTRPVSRRLIALYCLRSIEDSIVFHSQLRNPDPLASNLVVKFLARQSKPKQVLSFFSKHVHPIGIRPNKCTFPLLVTSAKLCKSINDGELLHCLALKTGFMFHVEIHNALIHLYALCDALDSARQVFDEMPERDVVSFNSMISGYVQSGDLSKAEALFQTVPNSTVISWSTLFNGYVKNRSFEKGLWFFNQMISHGLEPDDRSIVTLLSVLSHFKMKSHGKMIHGFILKRWTKITSHVKTKLLDFYLKSGLTNHALLLFQMSKAKDLFFYNTLISGLGSLGLGKLALVYFHEMQKDGIKPDEITFISLLVTCGHSGLVEEGLEYFNMMTSLYNIKPTFAHYWCLVDLLIRADYSDEALNVVQKIPWDSHSSLWGALIWLARKTGDISLGEFLGKKLVELEPNNSKRYIPLINIYAAASKWDKYWEVMSEMKERGLKKLPDCSLKDLNVIAHEFSIGDKRREEIKDVYEVLGEVSERLNLRSPLFDEDELNYNRFSVGFG
ncbi:hypothetical protein LUZ60_014583 [Juncus effusus]|nr:hypothetical protein LUZ60_014583 [Juncus effusus]